MHAQVWIIHRKRAGCGKSDGSINCLQTFLEQLLIVINATPTLAVKRVSDIELCARIALCGICALPFVARRTKLFPPKEAFSQSNVLELHEVVQDSGRLD